MSPLTNRLPGNSSRMSTHATTVPITAPIAALTSAAPSVIPRARRASGVVTDCQKADGLWLTALTVTAASGIRTMTLSHSVDSPRASPPPRRAARGTGRARGVFGASVAGAAGAAYALAGGSGDPRGLLDLDD